ncbi:MAG: chromophore lyase CpcT/CpeT [Planctomycetota bacterium]|nr:chromophore lyase CpcT/CpeT [Planctomycetota bacterium]
MAKRWGILGLVLLLGACCARPCCPEAPPSAPEVAPSEAALEASRAAADLDRLVGWMTGQFSSAKQAEADPSYFDIRLAMARIWRERDDGRWLYVEQAAARALERPYRQRIYRVTHVGGDLFESAVYALPDAQARAGTWEDPASFADLAPADLELLEGCAVLLRKMPDGTFSGSTLGSQCKNSFGNAKYATSEVTVTEKGILSWDRGYADEGKQVWGAEKAGYVFDKTRDLDP